MWVDSQRSDLLIVLERWGYPFKLKRENMLASVCMPSDWKLCWVCNLSLVEFQYLVQSTVNCIFNSHDLVVGEATGKLVLLFYKDNA